jgi:hypothetical protein
LSSAPDIPVAHENRKNGFGICLPSYTSNQRIKAILTFDSEHSWATGLIDESFVSHPHSHNIGIPGRVSDVLELPTARKFRNLLEYIGKDFDGRFRRHPARAEKSGDRKQDRGCPSGIYRGFLFAILDWHD